MARDQHIVFQANVNFLAAQAGILEFPSPVAGFIGSVRVESGHAAAGSDAFFDVHVGGASIWNVDQTQRVKIVPTATVGIKTGLAAPVAQFQKVRFDFDGGGTSVGGPLTVIIQIAETGALLNDADILDDALEAAMAGISAALPLHATTNETTAVITIDETFIRKVNATGVEPDATADTYGDEVEFLPDSSWATFAVPSYIALTSGGTFGAETLSVKLVLEWSDSTTTEIVKIFVAAGVTTELTLAEIFALMKDGVSLYSFNVSAKSSIGASTATGGARILTTNQP